MFALILCMLMTLVIDVSCYADEAFEHDDQRAYGLIFNRCSRESEPDQLDMPAENKKNSAYKLEPPRRQNRPRNAGRKISQHRSVSWRNIADMEEFSNFDCHIKLLIFASGSR